MAPGLLSQHFAPVLLNNGFPFSGLLINGRLIIKLIIDFDHADYYNSRC